MITIFFVLIIWFVLSIAAAVVWAQLGRGYREIQDRQRTPASRQASAGAVRGKLAA